MSGEMTLKTIAYVHSLFEDKFGIPRQSGLADLPAEIVFEPEYRVREAFRGLERYSHIWILWQFSGAVREEWSPTVRPPRLGGNARVGVFATRSPFRPNPIGLSSVRLEKVDFDAPNGPLLRVRGADILDGTPVYDIKPYLAYTDIHEDAFGGFSENSERLLEVVFSSEAVESIPTELHDGVKSLLAQDPRPAYQNDPDRIYRMDVAGLNIEFYVKNGIATVIKANKKNGGETV